MSLEGARLKGCTNLCIGLNSAREIKTGVIQV